MVAGLARNRFNSGSRLCFSRFDGYEEHGQKDLLERQEMFPIPIVVETYSCS